MAHHAIYTSIPSPIQNILNTFDLLIEKKEEADFNSLRSFGNEFWDNTEYVKILVEKHGYKAFQFASERIRNLADIAYLSLKRDGSHHPNSLEYLGSTLSDDIEFMKQMVELYGHKAFKKGSLRIRNNSEIAHLSMKKDGKRFPDSLPYLGEELRDNESYMHDAIKRYGTLAFQYASERLRNSFDIVHTMMKKEKHPDSKFIEYLGPDLTNSAVLMHFLVKKYGHVAFKYGSALIRDNAEIAEDAIKKDGGNAPQSLRYIGPKLSNDPHFMKKMCEKYGFHAFQHGSESVRDTLEIARASIKKDGSHNASASIKHLGPLLQDNNTFMEELSDHHGVHAFRYGSEQVRSNPKIAMKAIKKDGGERPASLEYVGATLFDNIDFMKPLCGRYGYYAFQFVSSRLKDLAEIASPAIEKDGFFGSKSLKSIGPRLRDNEEYMIPWIKRFGIDAFNIATERVRGDPRVVVIMKEHQKRMEEIHRISRITDPSG